MKDQPPDPGGAERTPARPRPMLGPAFWVALAFGLLCVLAGLALARLGPRLPPHRPAAATPGA